VSQWLWTCPCRHKQAVFDHLTRRWRDLFNISYDVLLYDVPIIGGHHAVAVLLAILPANFAAQEHTSSRS
jgi:hypothetical protein